MSLAPSIDQVEDPKKGICLGPRDEVHPQDLLTFPVPCFDLSLLPRQDFQEGQEPFGLNLIKIDRRRVFQESRGCLSTIPAKNASPGLGDSSLIYPQAARRITHDTDLDH